MTSWLIVITIQLSLGNKATLHQGDTINEDVLEHRNAIADMSVLAETDMQVPGLGLVETLVRFSLLVIV